MSSKENIRGYVRPKMPRLSEVAQQSAVAGAGVVYTESKDETLADAIQSLRRGDVLVVHSLIVLAPPKSRTTDKPRAGLWDNIAAVEAQGATILEVQTGRSSAIPTARDAMIRDAIEALATGGRRENGRLSKGRPPIEFTAAEIEQAKAAWFDLRHRTNADAIRASPARWTMDRSFKEFGPSGRGK
jgi:hypothetical protein